MIELSPIECDPVASDRAWLDDPKQVANWYSEVLTQGRLDKLSEGLQMTLISVATEAIERAEARGRKEK